MSYYKGSANLMEPRLVLLEAKTLIGQHQRMSLLTNTTAALWQRFRQRQKTLPFASNAELYSVQVYPANYFQPFRPEALFDKWAAVEAAPAEPAPADLETLLLPGGQYAVFRFRGPASEGPALFRYLLTVWLPASPYIVDVRPHFEILGEQYRPNDPTSEEDIWIPIRPRPAGPTSPSQ